MIGNSGISHYLSFILLLFGLVSHAQWVRSGNSLAYSQSHAIGHDGFGNVYTAGIFICNTVFGEDTLFNNSCGEITPPAPLYPRIDLFLTKHDNDGNLLWVRQYNGSYQNQLKVNGLEVDGSTGEIYLTGQFSGSIDFIDVPGLANPDNSLDFFVAKVDTNGQTLWAFETQAGGQSEFVSEDLAIDLSGVYLTGHFKGRIDFGTESDSSFRESCFISKLDLTGNAQWLRTISPLNDSVSKSYGIALDVKGSKILVACNYTDSILFENDTLVQHGSNTKTGAVCKFDTAGNPGWWKVVSAPDLETIRMNNSGPGFFLAGYSGQVTQVDDDTAFWTMADRAFLLHYDLANDSLLWQADWQTGVSYGLTINSIDLNDDGSILVLGDYYGSSLTGPNHVVVGDGDLNGFLALLDSTGSERWLHTIGGPGADQALGVSSIDDNQIFVAGYFSQYIRSAGEELFNPRNRNNAFIMKADRCPLMIADMISADTVKACSGLDTVLTITDDVTYSYQWFFNGSPLPGQTGWNLTTGDEGVYCAQITGTGCTKMTPASRIELNPLPPASLTTNDDLVQCEGNSVTFRAPLGIDTYHWFMDGLSMGLADTIESVTVDSSGIYHLETENAYGCTNISSIFDVQFLPFPSDSLGPLGKFTICNGDSVTMVADTVLAQSFQWFLNGDTLSTDTLGYIHAKQAGRYWVTMSNAIGCETRSQEDTLIIQSNPVILLNDNSFSPQLCDGDSLTIISKDIVGQTYQWKENGMDLVGETNNFLTVREAGNYQVFVSNSVCDSLSGQVEIIVKPTPQAEVLTPDQEVCEGNFAMLEANSGTSLTYRWLLNGSPVQGAEERTYSASAGGYYSVEVMNADGCVDVSDEVNVSVRLGPPATLKANGDTAICEGEVLELQASPGNNLSYTWYKDGQLVNGQSASILSVSQSGDYQVTVRNVNNCSKDSEVLQIKTVQPPKAEIGSDAVVPCEGDSIQLIANSGDYHYQWLFNNQEIEEATSATHYVVDKGDYKVIEQVGQCIDTSAVQVIDFVSKPSPKITINSSFLSTSCYPQLQWLLNGEPISGATGQNIQIKKSGFYQVKAVNAYGCESLSDSISFCLPLPNLIKKEEILQVDREAANYEWYYKGALIEGAHEQALVVQQSGEYYAITIEADGCRSRTPSIISCIPYPRIVVDEENQLLFAEPSSALSYQWFYDDVPLPGEDLHVLIPDLPGGYYVEITDFSGCTSISETYHYDQQPVLLSSGLAEHVSIYPNPILEVLHLGIKRSDLLPLKVSLFDMTGKELHRVSSGSTNISIDFSNYKAGVYTIYLMDNEGNSLKRKVVKHP